MKYRILFIEDEYILGSLVTEALSKLGYEVAQHSNGTNVLHAYRSFKPHLCLLDVMLPGKDGFEIAAQIRSVDTSIPIIFLTAKVQASDVVQGFKTGCSDYIRKPFSMDELVLRMERWLTEKYSQSAMPTADCYHLDGFDFFPQKQLLINEVTVIQLTHKEALLLQLLYQHRNNIIGRDFLLQKIWGTEGSYNSRSLDVYISRLRRYLGVTGNSIITLKGVGYRFISDCP